MATEWPHMVLGDALTLQRGFDLPAYRRADGHVPVIASTGCVGYHNEAKVKGPGVVIGRSGSLGGGQYIRQDFWPLNTTLWVKDFKGNDRRFCYYLILSMDFLRFNAGSGVPTLNRNHIHPLPIILPPLAEQKAIAHILGTLDDKIELNRRMNETLEAMARAIFKSWFVDFDPVHAKAEGRDPSLPADLAALFPDSFQDSPLGPIPRGWYVREIGKAVRCVGGATPSTKETCFWQGGTNPFATPKDMSTLTSPVMLDTERHITDAGVEKISSGRLPVGTVLLSSRAPIGYLAITEVPVSVNQGIIAMICDGDLPNYYVLYWTEVNMEIIKANAGGTTFAEISKRNFRPIQVLVPSLEMRKAFVEQVEPLHRRMTANLNESSTLAAIRDALLPKLLSGEIRIKDAEKCIE
ncbi:MAG: restriction endonuclease subunit S [Phycisphaerae bacterium]